MPGPEGGTGLMQAREDALAALEALVEHFCYAELGLHSIAAEAWERCEERRLSPDRPGGSS